MARKTTKSSGEKRSFGQITRLPSGRYRARYSDPDGRMVPPSTQAVEKALAQGKPEPRAQPLRHNAPYTFDAKGDAEAWLVDERRLITTGTWTPPGQRKAERLVKPLTFGEYAETWIKTRRVKGKPLAGRTRDGYRDLLERFILPTFGEATLSAITHDDVDAWYERVAPDTPTYKAHAYSLFRTIMGTAVDRGMIATANPAKVRGGGTTKRRHEPKPASLAELGTIVEAMPQRRRMMVQLAAWCGLRFGELAELRRKDIDLAHNVIKIRRGVVRVKDPDSPGGARYVRQTKDPKSDAGVRDVPIPPHLAADLRAHLLAHTAPGRDGLLFAGGTDAEGNVKHLTTSAFYGRATTFVAKGPKKGEVARTGHGWFEARRQAGREDLHFHDLRHTGLTNAAVAGTTLAELMAMAGHSTPAAAMRYQHAAADRMQDLAKRLSKMAEADQG